MKSLSVVIPAYNEEKRIVPTIQSVVEYLEKNSDSYEVIVADDGSRDNTTKVVQDLEYEHVHVCRLQQNKGKFGAFAEGVDTAQKDWILLYDADGSTPIESLDIVKSYFEKADCIIGSREAEGASIQVSQPGLRHQLGRLGNALIRLVGGLPFKDTQCGFKLIKTAYAKDVVSKMRVTRFAGDIELLLLLQHAGAKIVEVGVPWHHIDGSTVKSTDYLQVLYDLCKIRINFILGKYSK